MSRDAHPTFIRASELKAKVLAPHRWTVFGILAEGLALFVGRPKIGKSWWALATAIAVASGGVALGQIRVEIADVLYLSLEDNERRLKARMDALLGDQAWPERLTFATSWPRLDEGGLQWIEAWCEKHPQGRLIVIDTLQKVRGAASRNGTLYADDYKALEGLQQLASKRRLTIVVIHHTRKMEADDPLETVSGTQGLGGAADSVLVLKRDRARRDATLFVTGRDVEETEIAMRWDPARCLWTKLGEELSDERAAVIRVLKHADRPLSIQEISLALGRAYQPVKLLCWRMASAGQILSEGKGRYLCNPRTTETTETDSLSSELKVSLVSPVSQVSLVSPVSEVSGVQGYDGWADQEPVDEESDDTVPDYDPDELLSEAVR